jgi:hypothetical protein
VVISAGATPAAASAPGSRPPAVIDSGDRRARPQRQYRRGADTGRPEVRIHENGQVLFLNQEAPHRNVVCPVGLQQFRVGAEVEPRVEHGRQVNLAVVQSADLDAVGLDDGRQVGFLPVAWRGFRCDKAGRPRAAQSIPVPVTYRSSPAAGTRAQSAAGTPTVLIRHNRYEDPLVNTHNGGI